VPPYQIDTVAPFQSLKSISCITGNVTCWMVGRNEYVMRSEVPLTNTSWNALSFGAKKFDFTLSSKYLRPGVIDTVILQAIDRASPLRGFEKRLGINIGAGVDSTINTGMTRCGYGGATPACRP
jgi:hypothetical protein